MTREEVIEILRNMSIDICQFCNEAKHMSEDDRKEVLAIDMAIKLLETDGDAISRRAAIDAVNKNRDAVFRNSVDYEGILYDISNQPSAQPDVNECRKRGEWDMFELITSAWYGKQYYFKEDNGMAYSRRSHKTMTVHDAILEFIGEISDE